MLEGAGDAGSPPQLLQNEFPHLDFSLLSPLWYFVGEDPESTYQSLSPPNTTDITVITVCVHLVAFIKFIRTGGYCRE